MNKKYLLEQCKRLQSIDVAENIQYAHDNSEWWINHNKGHKILIDDFLKYLEVSGHMDKIQLKKWLRRKIALSDKIIQSLDMKYNMFSNDEEMNTEDKYLYSVQDGIICEALTLIEIINRKKYISKNAYTSNT